jgi:ClpP class serine protease
VIALIHRQDRVSFLGIPVASYINIEDSEAVLRAIRLTPDAQPIDLVLHTPGGLVLAAEQIARALVEHKGKVTVFVPHYAMSGGTMIALAADEIVMDPNAVLGPVDPQIGGSPAASIIKAVEQKPVERVSDETLILADMARKAQTQVQAFVTELLAESGQMSKARAEETGRILTEGRWTHDYPITARTARELGLKINTNMPKEVYALMDLYPQAPGKRPTVLYVEPPAGMRDGNSGEAPVVPKPSQPARPGPRK